MQDGLPALALVLLVRRWRVREAKGIANEGVLAEIVGRREGVEIEREILDANAS